MIAPNEQAFGKTDWHARLGWLTYACAQADHAGAAELLRAAWRLLGDPPADWRATIDLTIDELGLEALLHAGGEDAAALALLQGWAGFMVSHGPGGRFMATVLIDGRAEETTADGASAGLALLGALAAALSGDDIADGQLPRDQAIGSRAKLAEDRDRSARLN